MSLVLTTSSRTINQAKVLSKRIDVIDVLRSFALLGIILIHACNMYAIFLAETGSLNKFDSIINMSLGYLFRGRAFLIFSFLFGLSFAIQIQSAKEKNKPFIGRFIWRLTILSLIGFCHRLIYSADILQIYAILGLILVLCATLKNQWLLFLILLLYLASVMVKFYSIELPETITPLAHAIKHSQLYRFIGAYKVEHQIQTGRAFFTLGFFLLGLYAGRKNIFNDTAENRLIFKKALIWSIIAVLVTTLSYSAIKFIGVVSESLLEVAHDFTTITQAFFYVALIVNLYWVQSINKMLQWLVPMGRMGLTIYIMQSVFLTQFFGLGTDFIISSGLTAVIGFTFSFFLFLLIFAYWWMSNFLFGPIEWLWRVLINFKLEPIKRTTQPQLMI